MKTLGSSQRCWSFYLLIITLDLCLLTLEQLAFYFNGGSPHRTYENGLFSGSNGKMLARGCSVKHDGVGGEGGAAHLAFELRRGRELAVVSISASTE